MSLQAFEAVLVVSRDHPLASRQALDARELHAFVELTVHDTSHSSAYAGLQTFGGERVFYLSDFRTKKEALLQGLGFGWMPFEQVRHELQNGTLFEVGYQGGSLFSYSPLLVFRKNEPLGRAGGMLKEKLQQVFG